MRQKSRLNAAQSHHAVEHQRPDAHQSKLFADYTICFVQERMLKGAGKDVERSSFES
jgi:hypothetical protein